ncbi:DNA-binding protein snt1 [Paramarasmius palmivorus]|uniref:DNA-binding protein snt1 n=1 Tax=Paramarasmius palmivorus TaxID=297713 RepID=A0AAW0D8E9_9AGAR
MYASQSFVFEKIFLIHSQQRPPASHNRNISPPPARRHSGYDSFKPQPSNYPSNDYYYQDNYHDYGRPSGEGAYDRYDGPSSSNSRRSSRDYYDQRRPYDQRSPLSPNSPYNSSREAAGGWRGTDTVATRMFEPSDSWKQANGSIVNKGSPERPWASHLRNHSNYEDRYYRPDTYGAEAPAGSARYESYRPPYNQEGDNLRRESYPGPDSTGRPSRERSPRRSLSRGRSFSPPFRRRSVSRSRSRSRPRVSRRTRSSSPSRSRSRSPSRSQSGSRFHSRSRSRSRSPRRHFHPSKKYIDSEASTPARRASPVSRVPIPSDRDGVQSKSNATEDASVDTEKIQAQASHASITPRSPSHSSIASSRETSVKPTARAVKGPSPVSIPALVAKEKPDTPDTSSSVCPAPTTTASVVASVESLQKASTPVEPCPSVEDSHPPDAARGEINGDVKANDKDNSVPTVPDDQAVPIIPNSSTNEKSSVPNGIAVPPTGADTGAIPSPEAKEDTAPADSNQQAEASSSRPVDSTSSTSTPIPPPENITAPDFRLEDIPNMADATNVREALRVVVMTRLLADRQTREERVEPILATNLSIPRLPHEKVVLFPPRSDLIMCQMLLDEPGLRRTQTFRRIRSGLVEQFEARQVALKNKVQKLKEEYVTLHEKWMEHCAKLDEQAKAKAAEKSATETPVQPTVLPPATGRTTRRSAATLGDAVRSDFEMEQIIASIGYDEATDPNQLCVRNLAKIPDMISVTKGKVDYVFDDNNLRVDNPAEYYAPDTGVLDWTEEEKQIFLDKFAAYPKQFGIIAKYLPNKTPAQCVDFYYLHKKVNIDFRNVVAMHASGRKGKKRTGKRKGNALLADIRKHDAEVSSGPTTRGKGRRAAAAASGSATPAPSAVETRKVSGRKVTEVENTPTATPTPEPEARPRRRRAGPGAVSTSARTSLAAQNDPEEEAPMWSQEEEEPSKPAKRAKRSRKVKSAAIVDDDTSTPPPAVEDGPTVDTESISIGRKSVAGSTWSEEDKGQQLLQEQYGCARLAKIVANAPKRSPSPDAAKTSNTVSRADSDPPMASLNDDSDSRKASSSASKTPTPGETVTTAPVLMHPHHSDLPMYPGYNAYTSPYGASLGGTYSLPRSGYPVMGYSSYASSSSTAYPNGTYGRSAYYPYTYPYALQPGAGYAAPAPAPTPTPAAGSASASSSATPPLV